VIDGLFLRSPCRFLAGRRRRVVDLVGSAAFTRGRQLGLVSIVIAVSATFPVLPTAGGMFAFGERHAPTQVVGAGLVIAGLI